MSNFNAYYGKPEMVDKINIYPVCIKDWGEFSRVGISYLMIGEKFIENRVKVDIDLYGYITFVLLEEMRHGSDVGLKSFCRMLEIVTRDNVTPIYDLEKNMCIFKVGNEDKTPKIISRKNYLEIRNVINSANLIFEPLTAKDDFSNKMIQKNLAHKNKNASPTDLLAMIVTVTTLGSGVSDENMTYYALRAKYEIINRKLTNELYSMAIVQGGNCELIEFAQPLKIEENPYSIENMFTEVNRASDRLI